MNQSLLTNGYDVTIERVQGLNTEPSDKGPVELTDIPNIESYDILILGSPVWALSLPSAMKEYLKQIPLLYKKKVYLFVTMQFPFAFLGGNQAINQMKKICINKQAEINKSFVINWSSKKRESQINDFIGFITDQVKMNLNV